MTSSAEWKTAVTIAINDGLSERPAIFAELRKRFPHANPATVGEKISRFLVRDPATGAYRLRDTPRPARGGPVLSPESGRGWYDRFREAGLRSDYRAKFRNVDTNAEWTALILGMTRELGVNDGYRVEGKGGGGREVNNIDQSWFDQDGVMRVAIEHENNNSGTTSGLDSELNHLAHCSARLRVLITYLSAPFETRVEDVLHKIREGIRARDYDCEFLFLVAPMGLDDVRDYRAHLVKPSWTTTRI